MLAGRTATTSAPSSGRNVTRVRMGKLSTA
jgi:hypothetical protein